MKVLYSGLMLSAALSAQELPTLVAQDMPPLGDHVMFFQQAAAAPVAIAGRASTVQFVSGQLIGSTVKGSPYSADSVVESTQMLGDGNRIVNRNTTRQFRDSEGRERREMSMGPDGSTQIVMISDPVAGVSLTLNPEQRTAQKMVTPQMAERVRELRTQIPESGENVRAYAATTLGGVGMSGMMMNRTEVRVTSGPQELNASEENLGNRVIEGVMATGTRHKTTIPAGQIGNDRPIESITETWYSPDLKMTVLSETTDPRMGKTVMKLTNISRSEPSRMLFEVPAGYAVSEGPAGFTLARPAERIMINKEVQK